MKYRDLLILKNNIYMKKLLSKKIDKKMEEHLQESLIENLQIQCNKYYDSLLSLNTKLYIPIRTQLVMNILFPLHETLYTIV